MNKIITFSAIALVAVVMVMGAVAPAIAGPPQTPEDCEGMEIFDPNTLECVDSCPADTPFDKATGQCALDTEINENEKVVICHIHGQKVTKIEVSVNALDAHLAHGDTISDPKSLCSIPEPPPKPE